MNYDAVKQHWSKRTSVSLDALITVRRPGEFSRDAAKLSWFDRAGRLERLHVCARSAAILDGRWRGYP